VDSPNSSSDNGLPTEAYAPQASRTLTPRQAMALVAGDGTTPTLEIASLLRRRARVLGIIALGSLTVLIAFTAPGLMWWYWQLLVIYAVVWLAIAAATFRVWSGRPQSLAELRPTHSGGLLSSLAR